MYFIVHMLYLYVYTLYTLTLYIHYTYITDNVEGQKEQYQQRQSTPLSPLLTFFEDIHNLPVSDETMKYNIKGHNSDLPSIPVVKCTPPIVTKDVLNKYFEYLFEL